MKNLKRIFSYMSEFKARYITAVVLALVSSLCIVLIPLLIGNSINIMVYGNTNYAKLLFYFFALLILYVISETLNYLVNKIAGDISQQTMHRLRMDLFHKIQGISISDLDKLSVGDFISRMNVDVENVGTGLMQGTIQLLRGVGVIIGTMIVMISLNPIIGLSVVLLTPISLVVSTIIAKGAKKHYKKHSKSLGELTSLSNEYISNQRAIIANSYDDIAIEKFEACNEKTKNSFFYSHFYSALTNPSSRMINNFIYIVAGALGIYLRVSVGHISSFLIYSNQYTKPFNEITSVITDLQKADVSISRVFEILDLPELPDVMSLVQFDNDDVDVTFKNVYFSYDKKRALIKNFNLTVTAGEKIAIVGSTGSGKTTLINLLMRFHNIDCGEISIGGMNINSVPYESLRSHISMVLQESFIKNATVFENIAFGNVNATQEIIENASKKAQCYDIINRLSNGFDTVIDGNTLSKGEMQLICIARAMVENAPILILDEATSNIDSLTEIKIQTAFLELMKGKTSFVIAHRLSTIKDADRILVLENGNVAEIGNHKELIKKKGKYAKLYTNQYNVNE